MGVVTHETQTIFTYELNLVPLGPQREAVYNAKGQMCVLNV